MFRKTSCIIGCDLLSRNYIINIQKIHAETYLTVYDCKLGRETYSKQKKIVAATGFSIFPSWANLQANKQK